MTSKASSLGTKELRQNLGNSYVLLWNLTSEGAHELASGISIRPLASPITTFDLAAAGAAGFAEWPVLVPMAPKLSAEIESLGHYATSSGYGAQDRGWLAFCLLVLAGCGTGLPVAISFSSWDRVAGATNEKRPALPHSDMTLLEDFRLRFHRATESNCVVVTPAIAEWVRKRFDGFNRLASESPAFRFALEACFDWRYSHDMRAAIARLWAGTEALFNINAELTHRLSMAAASFLSERGPKRIEAYNSIKKLYAQRSRAVHGSNMDETELRGTLDASFTLLRDLVVLAASRGRVFAEADTLTAILG